MRTRSASSTPPSSHSESLLGMFLGWLLMFVVPPVLILAFHDVAWWQASKVLSYLWLAGGVVGLLEAVIDVVLTRRHSGPMTSTDDPPAPR